jgi:hypothetical protein
MLGSRDQQSLTRGIKFRHQGRYLQSERNNPAHNVVTLIYSLPAWAVGCVAVRNLTSPEDAVVPAWRKKNTWAEPPIAPGHHLQNGRSS